MEYYEYDNVLIVKSINDFDLEQTLECGQFFRFYKIEKEHYIIVAKKKMLRISQESNDDGTVNLNLYDTTAKEFEDVWCTYFDLDRDYSIIKERLLENDDRLKEAIEYKGGVRILNQDYFEMLMSFIISQNKQIPHIMKIVDAIASKYGKKVGEYAGREYYYFPDASELRNVQISDFAELKTGFRAPYLYNAVVKTFDGTINEMELREHDNEWVLNKLCEIKGVGSKVANCVMLFGLGRRDAFPVDVWMKRIMEKLYFEGDTKKEVIEEYAREHFGEYGGYAQQYLFYYARELKINGK